MYEHVIYKHLHEQKQFKKNKIINIRKKKTKDMQIYKVNGLPG